MARVFYSGTGRGSWDVFRRDFSSRTGSHLHGALPCGDWIDWRIHYGRGSEPDRDSAPDCRVITNGVECLMESKLVIIIGIGIAVLIGLLAVFFASGYHAGL